MTPPDLDVTTLRLLVALDERGSINAAAAALGLTQPAASARVRAFETRWRLAVVQRSARGSTLTTDGRAVVAWARPVLHHLDTMREGLAAMSAERGGEVAIAASLTVAEFLLPRWIAELRSRRPDLQPRLQVVNSARVGELVRSGAVDVGFIETAARPTDLQTRTIGHDRLVVVVAPGDPWARRRTPLGADALAARAWVMREPGSGTRSTFETAVRRQVDVALEASSTTALVGAALAGIGPAVVPARAVVAELETGRLVQVPVGLDLRRPLTAVWRPQERLPDAVGDLVLVAVEATRTP
ncbi:LysR family transcriptional regulator [Aeromicrobium sp. IC_218]|uniref:LysR family transcriptional regulator n=1 Tax=Aeromicrobium sp. IC_218 TaxID=2545468 RepID=UPI00103C2B65|nr:LysR family transcriptional regulator [Aeromicrobium sp. IC_218]TCJ00579.1 LysR family transcriptional regulator [Aeromicrobium sp. IC_218]